jgi:hypothetical protein
LLHRKYAGLAGQENPQYDLPFPGQYPIFIHAYEEPSRVSALSPPVITSGKFRGESTPPWRQILAGAGLGVLTLLALPTPSPFATSPENRIEEIVSRMKSAYEKVKAYRVETEVSTYRHGQVAERRRFTYTFEKPERLRIDMESPHPGMVLLYPDAQDQVRVRFGGWASFLHFHLPPDSSLLANAAGQRIDQTDFGLLIRNIAHSLTDQRRGPPHMTDEDGNWVLEVLAEDHFRKGVLTHYRFTIDKETSLPVSVQESTPTGEKERTVTFTHLDTSPDLPADWFKDPSLERKP